MISDTPQFITVLSSAARTASTTSSSFTVLPGQTLTLQLNITAASGTGGLTLRVDMLDPVSGVWSGICQDTSARTTTLTNMYQVGPGSTRSGGMVNASLLGYQAQLVGPVRVTITAGDASSYTYGITASIA